MTRLSRCCVTVCLLVFMSAAPQSLSAAEETVDYAIQVKPILARRCYSCHGSLQQESSLRLDTAKAALSGGDSGPAIQPGDAAGSLIIQRVSAEDEFLRMPPEGEPLTAEEIGLLARWIDQGAKAPADEPPQTDPRAHWAYVLPTRPELPMPQNADWGRNAIDAFVAARHDEHGLVPRPEAPPHVLLRRIYLDLIGLPPTPQELEAFLADESPRAYEKVVDRLLDSPHYGERWGRHWMDVWRYSDWDGYRTEVRESKPHIWRWRDWIIESLNADKPYDRMIVEMLAGDELEPTDPETLRATGFLVRNWHKFNRNTWLDRTIEHTGKAFLGVTFNCARCHDHKYDPIPQEEYFQLRAFFEPYDIRTDRIPGQPDPEKDGLVRVYDAKLEAPTYLFERGNEKAPDKDHPLSPVFPEFLKRNGLEIEPVHLPAAAYYPGLKSFIHSEERAKAEGERDAAHDRLKAARHALESAQSELAQAQQANEDGNAGPAADTPVDRTILQDDFAAEDAARWETGRGRWEYRDGKLLQTEPHDAQCRLTARTPHPRNFVARFRFRITGGKRWKSIGLNFDASENDSYRGVYLSANVPGPKLQVTHAQAGRVSYPPNGAKRMPVEVGREYELQVAVRDSLLNVWVDGKLQLAYDLSGSRPNGGRLAFWTYDATAEFLNVRVERLAPQFEMFERIDGPAVLAGSHVEVLNETVRKAEAEVQLAEAELAVAEAKRASVVARIAADQARYANPEAEDANDRMHRAAQAERELACRVAEKDVLAARQQVEQARRQLQPGDQKSKKALADAQAKLVKARETHEKAQARCRETSIEYSGFSDVYPQTSSGRRLALARWIASRENPLTARVAINHIWMRHIGSPLVESVFDFGMNGSRPTHPKLLDWLAVELIENGWRMKAIHRLIVTSSTYRMDSSAGRPDHSNTSVDPENRFLWRMNSRRMEAEIVRDSTLHVAGTLDVAMSGPDLDPNAGQTLARRSVYFRSSKEKKMTFLSLFDGPNVTECYRRTESIVPQQALAMANSALSLAQARVLAGKLAQNMDVDADESESVFVKRAFRHVLCRPPSNEEESECLRFLAEQAASYADPDQLTPFTAGKAGHVKPSADPAQRARESLVHVLLNHNEFVTIR